MCAALPWLGSALGSLLSVALSSVRQGEYNTLCTVLTLTKSKMSLTRGALYFTVCKNYIIEICNHHFDTMILYYNQHFRNSI